MQTKNHINITDIHDCSGCTACYSACPKQCISMTNDQLGFMYPVVDESKCIECGLCERTCPFINITKGANPLQCYVAKNKDKEELHKSSSGGIFIALAKLIIERKGVVFGAVFNDDWTVSHRAATTMDEVMPMMTSKYLQSNMGKCLSEVRSYLQHGRNVLFTGTPCQIAGLKHFLKRDYPNMLAVEVICHGVPSPTVWHNYLEEISARLHGGLDEENVVFPSPHNKRVLAITSINFRDKRLGWKKYGFSLNAQASPYGAVENSVQPSISEIYQPFNENRYMQAFLRNWSLRPSCFACKSKGGSSQADLTIGDFWGIDKYPEFTDTGDGTSCVIAHSMRGIQLLNDLSNINLLEVNYKQIFADNPSLEKSVIETDKAKKFRKLFPKIGFTRTMERLEHTPFCEKLRVSLRYRLSLILNKQN